MTRPRLGPAAALGVGQVRFGEQSTLADVSQKRLSINGLRHRHDDCLLEGPNPAPAGMRPE